MLSVADLADRCFLVWMASCGAALIIAYLGLRMAKTRHLCFGHLDVIVELLAPAANVGNSCWLWGRPNVSSANRSLIGRGNANDS